MVNFYINISKDNGVSWIKYKAPFHINEAIVQGQKLIYTTAKGLRKDRPDAIVAFNLEDNTSITHHIPDDFDCYFLTNYSGKIRLSGRKGRNIAVYSLQDNKIKHEYSYFKENDLFPVGFFNNLRDDWIIAGRRGPFSVSHKILKTSDKGKTWGIIRFDFNLYIDPFYFLDRGNMVNAWFYSGRGRFQVLK